MEIKKHYSQDIFRYFLCINCFQAIELKKNIKITAKTNIIIYPSTFPHDVTASTYFPSLIGAEKFGRPPHTVAIIIIKTRRKKHIEPPKMINTLIVTI